MVTGNALPCLRLVAVVSSLASLIYRVLFKRHVTTLQWFALSLLCAAIIVTKLSGDKGGIYVQPAAFLIAGVVSVLSVVAAILMEVNTVTKVPSGVRDTLPNH